MKKYLVQALVIALLLAGIVASAFHKKSVAVPTSDDNWPSQTQPK